MIKTKFQKIYFWARGGEKRQKVQNAKDFRHSLVFVVELRFCLKKEKIIRQKRRDLEKLRDFFTLSVKKCPLYQFPELMDPPQI